jgi:hypothetical protein
MRDYWLTQYILSAIGWGYLIAVLIVVALVLWLVKGKTAKTVSLLVVIGLASVLPLQGYKEYAKEKEAEDAYRVRLAKAQALFDERCKTAGEKIYRTVDKVDSVLLTSLRPIEISDNSQYDTNDQYGYNVGGEEYVRYYLIGSSDLTSRYQFVEAPREKLKLRYSTPLSAASSYEYWVKGGGKVTIESKEIDSFSARYSVEWQDVSTREDRDSWIAGGALRITDRKTGEVLGERVGYLFETGFGNTAGQRSPWPWARYYAKSCPTLNEHNRVFVEKVLKPIKGE